MKHFQLEEAEMKLFHSCHTSLPATTHRPFAQRATLKTTPTAAGFDSLSCDYLKAWMYVKSDVNALSVHFDEKYLTGSVSLF